MNISYQALAILRHLEIACELVYGEVIINGCREFDTTLEGLKSELDGYDQELAMNVHVWINVGNRFVIDPTISARINEHYDQNFPQHKIIYGTADKLLKNMKLNYEPMLTGVKFLERTCDLKVLV